jgi:hypothetical protein
MGYPSDHSSHAASAPQPTLISVARARLRLKQYSLRTEQADIALICRFRAREGLLLAGYPTWTASCRRSTATKHLELPAKVPGGNLSCV